MIPPQRSRRFSVVAEIALAFAAGAASFALVAVILSVADSAVVAIVFGGVCVGAICAIARFWGAAYAVPAAIAGLVAYDWFQFPPTHPEEFPDAANLADLFVYLAVGTLVGEVAAYSARRAKASETARSEVAEEQAALRRVATLVARGVPPPDVFAAVAREAGRLLGVDAVHLARYEHGDTAVGVGSWSVDGTHLPVGTRAALDGASLTSEVLATGRPARMDDYDGVAGEIPAMMRGIGVRSTVGAPIVVDGQVWGVMAASSKRDEPLPADSESRLLAFAELTATAISNAEAGERVSHLAEEQAALRRVAMLVAQERPPADVFAAVAEEVARLLRAEHSFVHRYEPDGTATIVAQWGETETALTIGVRLTLDAESVAARVFETRRPARLGDVTKVGGVIGEHARTLGIRSAIGAPIVVEGQLWGVLVAASHRDELPADTEVRIGEFTELVATAIANIEARSELAASRARVVEAADDERRRVVRDLHDGAQQRLVHTILTLKLARDAIGRGDETAPELVTEALDGAERAQAELRDLAQGILPAALTRGGLRAGVEALASRMPVPTEIAVSVNRLPAAVEATAYFVVAEALTNVAKHAHARHATVTADVDDGTVRVQVRDDGVGGVRPHGTGLLGLSDRLAALDGRLRVDSPAGGGTLVAAVIPLDA